jgi:hypothetical protein
MPWVWANNHPEMIVGIMEIPLSKNMMSCNHDSDSSSGFGIDEKPNNLGF